MKNNVWEKSNLADDPLMFEKEQRTTDSNIAGLGKVTGFLTVFIFGSVVWVLFQVLPFYYYSQEMQGFMESQASKASVFSDYQIRKFLLEKIKDLELPVEDKDDLKIYRANGQIVIELEYQEVLYVTFRGKDYTLHVFDFHPRAERNL